MNPITDPVKVLQALKAKRQLGRVTEVALRTNSKDNTKFVSLKIETFERTGYLTSGGRPRFGMPFAWATDTADSLEYWESQIDSFVHGTVKRRNLPKPITVEIKGDDGKMIEVDIDFENQFFPSDTGELVQEYVPQHMRRTVSSRAEKESDDIPASAGAGVSSNIVEPEEGSESPFDSESESEPETKESEPETKTKAK